jgi:chromosome segregation ATPase
MSDYVIPAEATAEVIKQLIDTGEARLQEVLRAVDAATDDRTRSELEREERRLQGYLGRLESRKASADVSGLKGIVEINRADIGQLKESSSRQGEQLDRMQAVVTNAVDRIVSLESFVLRLRDTVDAVDNQLRKQNALVFGVTLQDLDSVVNLVFHGASGLVAEIDDIYYLGKDPKKKNPLKIQFKTCSAAAAFIRYSKHPPFSTSRSTST